MKIGRIYTDGMPFKMMNVDLKRNLELAGNFAVPIERGLWMRFYPYDEEYYVRLGRKKYRVACKDDWDILVNKITVLFNLSKM